MNEVTTKAFIVSWADQSEGDARVTLYTEALGKIVAKARSVRKINSRLAGHLEPLTLSKVRLVHKKGYQIVDALAVKSFKTNEAKKVIEMLSALGMINALTNEEEPDQDLWNLLEVGNITSKDILRVLGFDPEHASCSECNTKAPKHFLLKQMYYVCGPCFTKTRTEKPEHFSVT